MKIWYHGDTSERRTFEDQRWDRERGSKDLNADGPGLYFASTKEEAAGYGPFLYAAKETASTHLIFDTSQPTLRFLWELTARAPEEDVARFSEDWELRPSREIFAEYIKKGNLLDVAVALYGDLFHHKAALWVKAMVDLGYSGAEIRRRRETRATVLVVWDPKVFEIVRVDGTRQQDQETARRAGGAPQ